MKKARKPPDLTKSSARAGYYIYYPALAEGALIILRRKIT